MSKEEIKGFIRHELLNIFTIINIYTSNEKITKKEKERIFTLIRVAALLVTYRDVFLGKKLKFNFANVTISEIIELLYYIFEEEIIKNKIDFTVLIKNCNVKADRNKLKECIELILRRIMCCTSEIIFECDKKDKSLIIKYKCKDDRKLEAGDLVKCLKNKQYENHEMGFQLALELLKMQGVKVSMPKNQVVLKFK
ncbi:hypothetical protein KKA95_04025 [Patescibacteria group bacterium]|nr:hypothetical protein [Patescibacteria group bacterium]